MTNNQTQEEKFLRGIIDGIVEYPEAINIVRTTDEMGVLLTLNVDPTDSGRVIGKDGITANAIRSVLRAVGLKNRSRISLKINA